MTPEKKVKNNVVKLLKDAGAYYFTPLLVGMVLVVFLTLSLVFTVGSLVWSVKLTVESLLRCKRRI